MTIRSDHNDKYAQPDGVWIGQRGKPTNVGFDGPALKGAENIVIGGLDHRETAFSAKAFAEMYRFIAGKPAATLAIVPEASVVLDGVVSGLGLNNVEGSFPTNLPLVGASLEVYATNGATGERLGAAVHRKAIGSDGHWGPFAADGAAHYEFVVGCAGLRHDAHLPLAFPAFFRDREPAPRADRRRRPRRPLDRDPEPLARLLRRAARPHRARRRQPARRHSNRRARHPSTAKVKIGDTVGRAVVGEFNDERIVGRAWPAAENQIVILDLTG